MGQADLEINRRARSVFVRHWIDIGHLSLRSVNSSITIGGQLLRIFGQKEELTPALVETIFKEIRLIPGVKHVVPALENWTSDGGVWRAVNKNETRSKKVTPSSETEQQKTYIIDE